MIPTTNPRPLQSRQSRISDGVSCLDSSGRPVRDSIDGGRYSLYDDLIRGLSDFFFFFRRGGSRSPSEETVFARETGRPEEASAKSSAVASSSDLTLVSGPGVATELTSPKKSSSPSRLEASENDVPASLRCLLEVRGLSPLPDLRPDAVERSSVCCRRSGICSTAPGIRILC